MKVQDVMTKDVKTVKHDATLKEVAATLAQLGVSGLPVVNEDGNVVGVVSEADIVIKERGAKPRHGLFGRLLDPVAVDAEAKLAARTAAEAMTSPAITIAPAKAVAEAAARMVEERVNRLPVVDEEGKLLGIVTRADLVRAFLRSDAEIAREIREDVILRTLWISPETVNVTVDKGEVTLTGRLDNKWDAELVAEFARRVPGVVSVNSKLTWVAENGKTRRPAEWVKQP